MMTFRSTAPRTTAGCGIGIVAVLAFAALHLPCRADNELAGRVARSVKTWSEGSGVVVTDGAEKVLVRQAEVAIADISQNNTHTSKARLEEVAPRAVVSHLERSQAGGTAPAVSDLIEQLATNAGVLLPGPTDFPTLKLAVVPPEPTDFVVVINGSEYRGGVTVFRVAASPLTVVISVTGKAICQFKIALKPGDVHTETCRRSG